MTFDICNIKTNQFCSSSIQPNTTTASSTNWNFFLLKNFQCLPCQMIIMENWKIFIPKLPSNEIFLILATTGKIISKIVIPSTFSCSFGAVYGVRCVSFLHSLAIVQANIFIIFIFQNPKTKANNFNDHLENLNLAKPKTWSALLPNWWF